MGNDDEARTSKDASDSSHESRKRSESVKTSASKRSEDSIDRLGNIMLNGFKSLENSFTLMGKKLTEEISNTISEQMGNEEPEKENDGALDEGNELDSLSAEELLKKLEEDFNAEDSVSENVMPSLAKLTNLMLSKKGNTETDKERAQSYLRPGNIEFMAAPKINKQIWISLSQTKKNYDKKLQEVQKQFLKSAVPVVRVIDEMNKVRADGNDIDLSSLISALSDSIALLGSANVNMVQARRELIKDELGPNLKGICSTETPFSAELLFGDKLNENVKEIAEARKLNRELHSPSTFFRRGGTLNHHSYPFNRRGTSNFRTQFRRAGRKFFGSRGRGYVNNRFPTRGKNNRN